MPIIKENKFELMDTNPELLEYVMAYTCWMFSIMFQDFAPVTLTCTLRSKYYYNPPFS